MNVEKASSYTLIIIFVLGIFVYLVEGVGSIMGPGLGAIIITIIILLLANYVLNSNYKPRTQRKKNKIRKRRK